MYIFAKTLNYRLVMEKITAIIPTYNEEIHIERAIQSVSFADEIIIIDSYSTDQTVEIATRYNTRIIQRDFDNFSNQKNHAIEQATNNWIVLLDSDERIESKLKSEIIKAINSDSDFGAYWIYRKNFLLNKEIKYSGWQNDKVVRVIHKEYCKYNGKLVHEEIESSKEIGFLKERIIHYTYKNFDSFISKKNKVAQLQAEELALKNQKATLARLILKPAFRFINHYILRLGFLDGFQGFFIASFYAYTLFTRYVKLWILNKGLK